MSARSFDQEGLLVENGAPMAGFSLVFSLPDAVVDEDAEGAALLYPPDVRDLRDFLNEWLEEIGL